MEKACCVVLLYSFVYGNKVSSDSLPCGSFRLVVEELCPRRGEAVLGSGKCLCEMGIPSLLGNSVQMSRHMLA